MSLKDLGFYENRKRYDYEKMRIAYFSLISDTKLIDKLFNTEYILKQTQTLFTLLLKNLCPNDNKIDPNRSVNSVDLTKSELEKFFLNRNISHKTTYFRHLVNTMYDTQRCCNSNEIKLLSLLLFKHNVDDFDAYSISHGDKQDYIASFFPDFRFYYEQLIDENKDDEKFEKFLSDSYTKNEYLAKLDLNFKCKLHHFKVLFLNYMFYLYVLACYLKQENKVKLFKSTYNDLIDLSLENDKLKFNDFYRNNIDFFNIKFLFKDFISDDDELKLEALGFLSMFKYKKRKKHFWSSSKWKPSDAANLNSSEFSLYD